MDSGFHLVSRDEVASSGAPPPHRPPLASPVSPVPPAPLRSPAPPPMPVGFLNGRAPGGDGAHQNLCFVTSVLAGVALALRRADAELGVNGHDPPPPPPPPEDGTGPGAALVEAQARSLVGSVVAAIRGWRERTVGADDGISALALLRMMVREGRSWRLEDDENAQQDAVEFFDELVSLLRVRPFFSLERRTFHGGLPEDGDRQVLPGAHVLYLDVPAAPPPGGGAVSMRSLLAEHLAVRTPPVKRNVITRTTERVQRRLRDRITGRGAPAARAVLQPLPVDTPTLQCLSFTETPRVLAVALKRFADDGTGRAAKLRTPVEVSHSLTTRPEEGRARVFLRFVVVHRGGDLRGGHYTSYVALPDPETPGRWQWCEFDDLADTATAGPEAPVACLRPCCWTEVQARCATDGYLFVYERDDEYQAVRAAPDQKEAEPAQTRGVGGGGGGEDALRAENERLRALNLRLKGRIEQLMEDYEGGGADGYAIVPDDASGDDVDMAGCDGAGASWFGAG